MNFRYVLAALLLAFWPIMVALKADRAIALNFPALAMVLIANAVEPQQPDLAQLLTLGAITLWAGLLVHLYRRRRRQDA